MGKDPTIICISLFFSAGPSRYRRYSATEGLLICTRMRGKHVCMCMHNDCLLLKHPQAYVVHSLGMNARLRDL